MSSCQYNSGSSTSTRKPSLKLNKSSGFMKFIVRNQLDRLEFDRFDKIRKRQLMDPSQSRYDGNNNTPRLFGGNRPPDDYDLPEEWDPHYELRMKLRLKIEKEHNKCLERSRRNSNTEGDSSSSHSSPDVSPRTTVNRPSQEEVDNDLNDAIQKLAIH